MGDRRAHYRCQGMGQGRGGRARAAKSRPGHRNARKIEAFIKTSKNFENQKECCLLACQREALEILYSPRKFRKRGGAGTDVLFLSRTEQWFATCMRPAVALEHLGTCQVSDSRAGVWRFCHRAGGEAQESRNLRFLARNERILPDAATLHFVRFLKYWKLCGIIEQKIWFSSSESPVLPCCLFHIFLILSSLPLLRL